MQLKRRRRVLVFGVMPLLLASVLAIGCDSATTSDSPGRSPFAQAPAVEAVSPPTSPVVPVQPVTDPTPELTPYPPPIGPAQCPSVAPAQGQACSYIGALCKYGSAIVTGDCQTLAFCTSLATWEMVPGKDCGCPSLYDVAAGGGACPKKGAICSFTEGTCGCIAGAPNQDAGVADASMNGGDVPGDDAAPSSGGPSADAGANHWRCVPPPQGCPTKIPGPGETCVVNMTCDYGSCELDDTLSMSCIDGRWFLVHRPLCP